jgi:hypothetical protein
MLPVHPERGTEMTSFDQWLESPYTDAVMDASEERAACKMVDDVLAELDATGAPLDAFLDWKHGDWAPITTDVPEEWVEYVRSGVEDILHP